MTGWRLGWVVVPDHAASTPSSGCSRTCTSARRTCRRSPRSPRFDATDELDGHVARYAATARLLIDGLAAAGMTDIAAADGAFYVYADVAAPDADVGSTR